jgi:hypothetical protein
VSLSRLAHSRSKGRQIHLDRVPQDRSAKYALFLKEQLLFLRLQDFVLWYESVVGDINEQRGLLKVFQSIAGRHGTDNLQTAH